jgi:hypothetical protein
MALSNDNKVDTRYVIDITFTSWASPVYINGMGRKLVLIVTALEK